MDRHDCEIMGRFKSANPNLICETKTRYSGIEDDESEVWASTVMIFATMLSDDSAHPAYY